MWEVRGGSAATDMDARNDQRAAGTRTRTAGLAPSRNGAPAARAAAPDVEQLTTGGDPFGLHLLGAPAPAVGAGRWHDVIDALHQSDPIAGARDYRAALRALEPLAIADALLALDELARLGELDAFAFAVDEMASSATRLAIRAVRVARNLAAASRADLDALTRDLARVPLADQGVLVAHIAAAAGDELMSEGVTAALQTTSIPMPSAAIAATSPVGPGAWAPPGDQPVPLYIGTQAHEQIADRYAELHGNEEVFTNTTPVGSMLGQLDDARSGSLDEAQRALRPDITNLTLRHIYEIKPASGASEAASQLALYLGVFRAAGLSMTAGPTNQPGTAGVVEAPAGYFIYECVMPGVILYQYRRGQYVPASEPSPTRAPVSRPGLLRRLEEATGLSGTALVVYLIVSEASRAFPPRNLIPAP